MSEIARKYYGGDDEQPVTPISDKEHAKLHLREAQRQMAQVEELMRLAGLALAEAHKLNDLAWERING